MEYTNLLQKKHNNGIYKFTKYKQCLLSLWCLSENTSTWYEYLRMIKEYLYKYDKIPSNKSTNSFEKKLGKWLSIQFINTNPRKKIMLNDNIYNSWLEFLHDSKYNYYFSNSIRLWYIILKKVKIYLDKYGNRPPHISNEPNVKMLGQWLYIQTKDAKTRKYMMFNNNIYDSWLKFIKDPKYSKYFIENITNWFEKLEKVKEFINKNNKIPLQTSKDISEKILGTWLDNQLKCANPCKENTIKDNIYDSWLEFIQDPEYSKYFSDSTKIWFDNLKQVNVDININIPIKRNHIFTSTYGL